MIRSAVLIQYTHVTDGQTDGIGVAYNTRYSIYAVARKKPPSFSGVPRILEWEGSRSYRFREGRAWGGGIPSY